LQVDAPAIAGQDEVLVGLDAETSAQVGGDNDSTCRIDADAGDV
jgi:hypothetical protein